MKTKEEIEKILWELFIDGKEFNKSNLKALGLPSYNTLMRRGVRLNDLKRSFKELIYSNDPKICPICLSIIDFKSRENRFCSHRCSAINSNLTRSPDSKRGPPKGYRKGVPSRNKPIPPYTKISYCNSCAKAFPIRKGYRKVCSDFCLHSIIKRNRGRGRRSYMEESFSFWLDSHCVTYETEVQFRNDEENKFYYVDFLFRDLNLIIELDGSQHKYTKDKDNIRDRFLTSIGFYVLRVSHEEYQNKSKCSYIKSLLNIG